jgi:hypothetical protein
MWEFQCKADLGDAKNFENNYSEQMKLIKLHLHNYSELYRLSLHSRQPLSNDSAIQNGHHQCISMQKLNIHIIAMNTRSDLKNPFNCNSSS